jgi:hypothetical protein
MKYTDSKRWQEIIQNCSGNNVDTYIEQRKLFNEKEQKINDALEVLRETSKTNSKLFVHCLLMQHRTHQQSIIKCLHDGLLEYGQFAGSDPRNEDAVKWSKNATSEENYFPYI